jgi:hypothetical protein
MRRQDETQVTLGYHAVEFLLWGRIAQRKVRANRPYMDYVSGDPIRDRRRACLRLQVELLIRDLTIRGGRVDTGARPVREHVLGIASRGSAGRALSGPATLAAFELAIGADRHPLSTGMQEQRTELLQRQHAIETSRRMSRASRACWKATARTRGLLAALDAAAASEIRDRLARHP